VFLCVCVCVCMYLYRNIDKLNKGTISKEEFRAVMESRYIFHLYYLS